jgi:hypothetical protein
MGCGLHVDRDGDVTDCWPDEFDQAMFAKNSL